MMLFYFFAAVALLAILTVFAGIKVVRQGYQYTIERFGRFTKVLKPGLKKIAVIGPQDIAEFLGAHSEELSGEDSPNISSMSQN